MTVVDRIREAGATVELEVKAKEKPPEIEHPAGRKCF
jgi:hypothetical protein